MFTCIKGNDYRLADFQKKLMNDLNERWGSDWGDDDYYHELLEEINKLSNIDSQYVFLIDNEVKFIYYKESIDKDYLKKDYPLLKLINPIIISGIISVTDGYSFAFEQLSKEYSHLLLIESDEFYYSDFEKYYDRLSIEINNSEIVFFWNYLIVKNSLSIKNDIVHTLLNDYQIDFDSIGVKMFDMEKDEDKLSIEILFENELYVIDKRSNASKYFGFHYLDRNDIYPYSDIKGLKLFVAIGTKNGVEKPLSVLKIAEYSYPQEYFGLNYINTSTFYQKKGLTKLLYQSLNNFIESLEKEVLFISTNLSNEGKEANLNILRKKYLVAENCKQFDNDREYSIYQYSKIQKQGE